MADTATRSWSLQFLNGSLVFFPWYFETRRMASDRHLVSGEASMMASCCLDEQHLRMDSNRRKCCVLLLHAQMYCAWVNVVLCRLVKRDVVQTVYNRTVDCSRRYLSVKHDCRVAFLYAYGTDNKRTAVRFKSKGSMRQPRVP